MKAYTKSSILRAILKEIDQSEAKFPQWPTDPIHGAAIVAEEAGELIRASVMHTYEGMSAQAMEKEAIQTACVAIRFLAGLYDGYLAEKRYLCSA